MSTTTLDRKTTTWLRRISAVVAFTMLGRLIGFLYPVLVLRQLSNSSAGLAFFFINSAYFVVQPVSGGPAMAMVRPLAAASSESERGQWLRAAVAITVPAVVLTTIIGVAVCLSSGAPVLPMLLMVAGLSADAMYFQILTARYRYVVAAIYRLIANVAQLAALVFVLALGFRSVTLVVGIFALSYFVGFAAAEWQQRTLIALIRRAVSATRAQRRSLMKAALPTLVTGLAYSGIVGLDTFLVRIANRDLVAGYGAAKTLAAPFLLVSLAVMTIVQPEAARADLHSALALRRRILRLGACGGAVAIAACWLFSGVAVRVVYGIRYPEAAMTLRWLGTGTTLLGLYTLLQMWCWGRGRYMTPLMSLGTGAIAAVGCNLLLVPHLGTRGAGIAVCLGSAVATALLVLLSRPTMQFSLLQGARRIRTSNAHSFSLWRVARIFSHTDFRIGLVLLGAMPLAMGAGYVIAHIGLMPTWELLAICLLAPSIILAWRTSFIHPLALFPTLYLAYFLVGSQNWVERAGYTNFRTFVNTNSVLRLPVLGLVAYMCGSLIVSYKTVALRTRAASSVPKATTTARRTYGRLKRAGMLLGVVGLAGAAAAVAHHGLVVSNPEARAGGLGKIGVFAYALIPSGVLLAVAANKRGARAGLLVGVSLLLLATVGFRTTVVILVLSYLVFTSMEGHLRPRSVVIGLLALVLLAFAVNAYRLDRNGNASAYGTAIVPTHILAQVPALTSLYYEIPHEGVAVLNSLVSLVPADHAFMNGRLQLATFETAIPHSGKRIDSRGLVTQLVYGTSIVSTSLTPTILGGPYVDFGLVGVIVEMGLLGAFLAYLYQRARHSESPIPSLAYAYFVAVAIVGIHGGLLDVQFEIILPALTATALWLSYTFSNRRVNVAREAQPPLRQQSDLRAPVPSSRMTGFGRMK